MQSLTSFLMIDVGQDLICFFEMFIFVLTWLVMRIMMILQWIFMAIEETLCFYIFKVLVFFFSVSPYSSLYRLCRVIEHPQAKSKVTYRAWTNYQTSTTWV
ncbi:hypothetical protein O6H91_10G034100 [Diphasiastrum complanatum]|uniref:Uncharacterized protein n=1 Tax=Diphasiastrum complanatum TaxID=34168 RepID=A0ACC2CG39_DIPCM|nr:hypothetical protein O6H91_10G034100 [Diphasiastrum complanatum]